MHVIEAPAFFIHSPSIPMTLKDVNGTAFLAPPPSAPEPTTMDPGHRAILEMHENSEASALFYVGVVLVLYILALVAVLSKYRRSERYESRLTRLYDDFIRRDRYLHRIPKRVASEIPPVAPSAKDKRDFVVKINDECSV